MDLRNSWWKVLAAALVFYTIIGGFLVEVPELPILNETIRNLYFHVTMWFAMIILMTTSLIHSIKYLRKGDILSDVRAREYAHTGVVLGLLGTATGSLWARYTWGDFWVNDVKLNGAAITILIYLAYIILRNSVEDNEKRGKLAAVYNIFSYSMLVVFLIILPRTTDSLHPGNGGNPGFSQYEEDLNTTMRMIFYPAILGWTLTAWWITHLRIRISKLNVRR